MSQPVTVGEIVDRDGPCELMVAVMELAQAHGRIPVGWWVINLPNRYRLSVNGTPEIRDGIHPWECRVDWGDLPVASFNTAGGTAIDDSEDLIIASLRTATAQALKVSR